MEKPSSTILAKMVSDAARKKKNQKKKLRAKLKKLELQQEQQEQLDPNESRQSSAGTNETNDSSISTNDEETELSDNDELDSEYANQANTSATFLNSVQDENPVAQHANEDNSVTEEIVEDVYPETEEHVVGAQDQDSHYIDENNENTLLEDVEDSFGDVNKNEGNSDNLFDERGQMNNDDLFGANGDREEHIEFLSDKNVAENLLQKNETERLDLKKSDSDILSTSAINESSSGNSFPSSIQAQSNNFLKEVEADDFQIEKGENVIDNTFQNNNSDLFENEHDDNSASFLAGNSSNDAEHTLLSENEKALHNEDDQSSVSTESKKENEKLAEEKEVVKPEAVDEAAPELIKEAAPEPVEEVETEVAQEVETEVAQEVETAKTNDKAELPEHPTDTQYNELSGTFDNASKTLDYLANESKPTQLNNIEQSKNTPQEHSANPKIQLSESHFDDIFGESKNDEANEFLFESVKDSTKSVPAEDSLFSDESENANDFASMINSVEVNNPLSNNMQHPIFLNDDQQSSNKSDTLKSISIENDISKSSSTQEETKESIQAPLEAQHGEAKEILFSKDTQTLESPGSVPADTSAAKASDSLLASSDEENEEIPPLTGGTSLAKASVEAKVNESKKSDEKDMEVENKPGNGDTTLEESQPLENKSNTSALEQFDTQEKFAFLSDDDDLLDDDDDSFLASDDDEIESMSVSKTPLGEAINETSNLSSKNLAQANNAFVSNEKGPSSLNKYAPSTPSASLISESLGGTYQAQQATAVQPNIVQPTLNFIQPRSSVTPSYTPNPPVSDQSTITEATKVTHEIEKQKHKTDAYDFPIDLVSNLKKPAKAKPVAVKVASAQKLSTSPNQLQQSTLPGIPLNTGPNRTSSASSGTNLPVVNPYAPRNPSVASNASPPVSTNVPVGIVPPPLSYTKDFPSQKATMPGPPMASYIPPASANKFANTVSNTDLPAGLVPPIAKIEKPVAAKSSPVNPYAPTNLGNRSRAFSNASSHNSFNMSRNTANVVSSKPNPYAPSAKNRSRTASINSHANSAPKSSNFLHPPAGTQTTGPANPYAPNQPFHVRRNSSLKEANAPIRARTSSNSGNNPMFNPGSNLPALQTMGLNNVMGVTGLSSPTAMSPVGGLKKKTHARSHSSVYAPSGAGNASKYAPTVHPSYHQQQPSNSNFGPQPLSSAPPPFGFKKPSGGSASDAGYNTFAQPSVSHSSHPIPNPETLRARQFPIFHWNGNTKAVYMLPTNGMYQQTPITVCDSKKFDVVPQYFIDFPGPLTRGKTKAKNLEPWIDTAISQLTSGRDEVTDMNILLWKIIKWKVVSADGKLSEIAGMFYDTTELDIVLNDMSWQHTSAARKFNAFKLEPQDQMQVLASLQVGNHSRALSLAMSHYDYPMAMIISSLMGKEKWSEVVDIYLRSEFNAGNDNEFSANLLGVIFQVFVGNSKKLIDDFYGDINKATWAMDNWNVILAAIFANSQDLTDLKTPNSISPLILDFLIDFGIFLLRRKQTLAAHICFVVADVPLSFNEIIPESQIIFDFLGSPNSFESILLSELYEFSFKPSDSQAAGKFSGFQTLVSQKLLHASILFENNSGTLASKYIDTASAILKHLPKNSPVSVKYMYFIDELKSRVSNINNGWLGKPTLSGVWGQLDKSFNKFIGGDDLTQLEKNPSNENKVFDSFTPNPSRSSSHIDLSASLNGSVYNPLRAQPVATLQSNQANTPYASPSLLKNDAHAQSYLPNYAASGVKSLYEPRSNVTKHAVSQLRNENIVQRSGPPSVGSIVSSENLLLGTSSPRSHIRNPSIESTLANQTAARVPAAKRPFVSDIPASGSTQAFTPSTIMPPKQTVNKRHSVTFSGKGAGKSGSVVSLDELYGAPPATGPSQNLDASPQKVENNHEQNLNLNNERNVEELTNKNNSDTEKDTTNVANPAGLSVEASSFVPSFSSTTDMSTTVQQKTNSFAPAAPEAAPEAALNLDSIVPTNGPQEENLKFATKPDFDDELLTSNAEENTKNAQEEPIEQRDTINKAANFSFPPRKISPQAAVPAFAEKKSLSPHAPDLTETLITSPFKESLQTSNSPSLGSYAPKNVDSKASLSQKYSSSFENTHFQPHFPQVGNETDHAFENDAVKEKASEDFEDLKISAQESTSATSNFMRTNSSILKSPAKTASPFSSTFAPPPPVFGGGESMRMRTPTGNSNVHTPIRSHSRTSSQLLADITGNTRSTPAPEGTPGADPVIRQVRVNSVVYTPETTMNQNVYYDDIVEEEDSDDEEDKLEKKRVQEEAAEKEKRELERRKREEEEAEKKEKAKKEGGKKEDSKQAAGWFGWLKNGSDPNAKKPVKAKLGHKNTFYYDEKLKRWIDKNASEEEKAAMVETSPPPPPPIIKRKAAAAPEIKPRSGSVAGGPTQRTLGMVPPKNPLTGESLLPETDTGYSTPSNTDFPTSIPEDAPAESTNLPSPAGSISSLTPTPSINLAGKTSNGLDDLISLTASRRATPSGTRKGRRSGRGYVNVMDNMNNA